MGISITDEQLTDTALEIDDLQRGAVPQIVDQALKIKFAAPAYYRMNYFVFQLIRDVIPPGLLHSRIRRMGEP